MERLSMVDYIKEYFYIEAKLRDLKYDYSIAMKEISRLKKLLEKTTPFHGLGKSGGKE